MSIPQQTSSVPVFTGANWAQWWPSMIAYIEATGCGWALDFPAPMLDPKADKKNRDFYIAWTKANTTIVGSIKLHFLDSLKNKFLTHTTATSLIKSLKEEYSTPGISGTFVLFKELLDMKIAQFSHLAPSLNKVSDLFACLKSAGYEFPENIQAMLLLAKLPQSMDVVAQIIAQAKDTSGKQKTPTVKEIREAAVLSWDQRHMKETPKAAQANKISTVKCKVDDPKFEQQQLPQGDGLKKKWKCGKHTGKKQKEKELKGSFSHAHAHIALVTYTSSPELPVNPHALTHRPALMYQDKQGPPFHTGIKDAITLAHWLELPVTCENVRRLDTGLQIQGPGFLSATVHLLSSIYTSSPCPLSLSFPSAHDTSPLKYHLGIPASNYDFDVVDHRLLDDEWLNGDSSTSRSLLYQAAEMQDEYPLPPLLLSPSTALLHCLLQG